MKKTVEVRFLVPKPVQRKGRIDYQVETRTIRLPIKRGDRFEMLRRLDREGS